jgi:hypothetical protein
MAVDSMAFRGAMRIASRFKMGGWGPQALSRKMTLVTANVKEFGKVREGRIGRIGEGREGGWEGVETPKAAAFNGRDAAPG